MQAPANSWLSSATQNLNAAIIKVHEEVYPKI